MVRPEGRRYIWYGGLGGSVEEFVFPCCTKLISSHWCCERGHQDCLVSLWDYVQDFFLDACVCEECAPHFPFSRLPGCSGFGDYLGRVEEYTSGNIQEIISLGGSLMRNDSAICGGRMELIFFVRDWSGMLKYLESKSAMILSIPLVCWDYRDTLLTISVQPNHSACVSWPL